ncbi:TIM barrel protein, partial [Nanoarchaeota archaeon]
LIYLTIPPITLINIKISNNPMKVGIKVYFPSELKFIKRFPSIDFVEIMAVVGHDYSKFKDLNIPIIIHNQHSRWGVNMADPQKRKHNAKSLNYSIKLADMFEAKHIILHPGQQFPGCSEEELHYQLSRFPDKRIILENLPSPYGGIKRFGYDYKSMKRILKTNKRRMNLDFPHASETATRAGKKPIPFIKKLMTLKPAHFHMSDTRLQSLRDMHLHLQEGNLPLPRFKKLLPPRAWITLEVDHNYNKTKHDIEFLKN